MRLTILVCDQCGRRVEPHGGGVPDGWWTLSVNLAGRKPKTKLAECCSKECAIALLEVVWTEAQEKKPASTPQGDST